MNIHKVILLSKELLFNSSKDPVTFAIDKKDKFIISAHALFEGIGIAGLISAAFWYTTAPMAPDGFKGPISTFTITVSTIASLFLAIPIAYYSFKKLIADLHLLHRDVTTQLNSFITTYDELVFSMLKCRSLFFTDEEFKAYLSFEMTKRNVLLDEALIGLICTQYKQLNHLSFVINWQHPISFIRNSSKNLQSVSFLEIMQDKDLSSNPLVRKAFIDFYKDNLEDHHLYSNHILEEVSKQAPVVTEQLRNTLYGIASGVACTEVLLSIGWSVISILIGVEAIAPISNYSWALFAIASVFVGVLFGLGMGLSRHKQKINQLFSLSLKEKNDELIKMKDKIATLITEKLFMQQRMKKPVQLIN